MRRWLLAGWLCSFAFGACSSKDRVTEGDRQLSHQNVGAARVIKTKTQDPAITTPATDIEANSGQQLENWGPPENPQPYSEKASKESREQSKEEHESSPFWPIALGVLGTALGWASRATPLGNIPFLGNVINAISPRLANGATKNEAIALGLQASLDEGRIYLDRISAELKTKLSESSLPEPIKALADKIPTGNKLVEIIRKQLAERNLLDANTRLYDAKKKAERRTVAAPPQAT